MTYKNLFSYWLLNLQDTMERCLVELYGSQCDRYQDRFLRGDAWPGFHIRERLIRS